MSVDELEAINPSSAQPSPRRRTRRSPTVRRQDLLTVTVSCLARLGARGTTGREICRQAGVSHGLIRHYFRNPDNLLFETYEQLCEDMLASLAEAARAPAATPWEALHNFFVAVFSSRWSNPEIIGAWMVFWPLVRSREDFAAVSENYNTGQRALLEQLVQALPWSDAIPVNDAPPAQAIPVEQAVAIISAVMDGLWIDFYLSDKRTPAELCIELCDKTARRLFVS